MPRDVQIKILNFDDNEIVNYSLVLIKGSLVYCNGVIVSADCKGAIKCQVDKEVYVEWPLVDSSFRSLVQLKPGKNNVYISFGEITKKICIIYRNRNSTRYVVPIYFKFMNHSGEFECPLEISKSAEVACKKIGFCSKLVQCLYAEKLFEQGMSRKTFQLETDVVKDAPECRIFNSGYRMDEARQLDEVKLWEALAREVMSSEIGREESKYLGVTSSTWTSQSGEAANGDVALGSGGLALVGSLALCTWPKDLTELVNCLLDQRPLHPPLCNNLWYRGTRGGCWSASVGSICHELGHTFDLAHPDKGIMSTDFHLIYTIFMPPVKSTGNSNSSDAKSIDISTWNTSPKNSYQLDRVSDLAISPSSSTTKAKLHHQKHSSNLNWLSDTPLGFAVPNFSTGCANILACHPWFNDCGLNESDIVFDSDRWIVKSEAGLKVVQVRRLVDGKVLRSWELSGNSKCFVLPRALIASAVAAASLSCSSVSSHAGDIQSFQEKTNLFVLNTCGAISRFQL